MKLYNKGLKMPFMNRLQCQGLLQNWVLAKCVMVAACELHKCKDV